MWRELVNRSDGDLDLALLGEQPSESKGAPGKPGLRVPFPEPWRSIIASLPEAGTPSATWYAKTYIAIADREDLRDSYELLEPLLLLYRELAPIETLWQSYQRDSERAGILSSALFQLRCRGEVALHATNVVAQYSLLSAWARRWLRYGDTARAYLRDFTAYTHSLSTGHRRRACIALLELLCQGAEPVDVATTTTSSSVSVHQQTAADFVARIQRELPPVDAPVAKVRAIVTALVAADDRVKDLVFADTRAMERIVQAEIHPAQLRPLIAELDTVEGLYRKLGHVEITDRYGLIYEYLLARPGPVFASARKRVLSHTRLKDQYIDKLSSDPAHNTTLRRRVIRVIVRGTEQPTAIDRVYLAVADDDGRSAARALIELARQQPEELAALKNDQQFRNAVREFVDVVVVDGIELRPYELCLYMWGLRATDSASDYSINERRRDLEIVNRLVFQPALRVFADQLGSVWRNMGVAKFYRRCTQDARVKAALRTFEQAAAKESARLTRLNIEPGAELSRRHHACTGANLRHEIRRRCRADVLRYAERILGLRRDVVAISHAGVTSLSAANVDSTTPQDTKPTVTIEDALATTFAADGRTLSQLVHDTSHALKRELGECSLFGGADLPDVCALRNEVVAAFVVERSALYERTCNDAFADETECERYAIFAIRRAYTELAGSLKAALIAAFRGQQEQRRALALFDYRGALRQHNTSSFIRFNNGTFAGGGAGGTWGESLSGAEKYAADRAIIDDRNRHLVAPDFTEDTARHCAAEIWRLLHDGGEVRLITTQLFGRFNTEEKRLISIEFCALSGGVSLAFYLRRAMDERTRRQAEHDASQVRRSSHVSFTVFDGEDAIQVHGNDSELLAALKTAEDDFWLGDRLRIALAQGDDEQVFRLIENAEDDDRHRVLANESLLHELHQSCEREDSWDRIYKGLTGQLDLTDMLATRSHGKGAFEFLGGTDEAGMTADIKAYVARKRRAIAADIQVRLGSIGAAPQLVDMMTDVDLRRHCELVLVDADVAAILDEELTGDDRAEIEGLFYNAGKTNPVASALGHDPRTTRAGWLLRQIADEELDRLNEWFENESELLAAIRAMPVSERRRRRDDPEFISRIAEQCTSDRNFRDAWETLNSNSEAGQLDRVAILEEASRGTGTELDFDWGPNANTIATTLVELNVAEFRALRQRPELIMQIFRALMHRPKILAYVRRHLRFTFPEGDIDATAELAVEDPDQLAERRENNRIAFVTSQAIARIKMACARGYDALLKHANAVCRLDLPECPEDRFRGWLRLTSQQGHSHPRLAIWKATRTSVFSAVGGDSVRAYVVGRAILGVSHSSPGADGRWWTGDDALGVSTERLRHNTGWWDENDDIDETLANASDEVLIHEWTTVMRPGPAGQQSLHRVYAEYRRAQHHGDLEPEAAHEALLAFVTFVIDISARFERMLLPHAGSWFSAEAAFSELGEAEQLTRVRHHKQWRTWCDAVRGRIVGLDATKIAQAIGITDQTDLALIENPTRRALTLEYQRQQAYLAQRGENEGDANDWFVFGSSQAQAEYLDQAMWEYQRARRLAQTDDVGCVTDDGYGLLNVFEAQRLTVLGDEVDFALAEFRAAKEQIAEWASLVAAVVISAAVTVLSAGSGSGLAFVLMQGAISGALAGTGSALVKNAVLGGDYDLADEGLHEIASSAIRGVVIIGGSIFGQAANRQLVRVAGAASAAQRASLQATLGPLRMPSAWAVLGEGVEEVFSETFEGGVWALLAVLDPENLVVAMRDGLPAGLQRGFDNASEEISQIPRASVQAFVSSIAIGQSMRVKQRWAKRLGRSNREAVEDALEKAKRLGTGHVDVVANLREYFDDALTGNVMIEAFVEWAMGKLLEGEALDLNAVPAELLVAFLEELKESGVDAFTQHYWAGARSRRVETELAINDSLPTDDPEKLTAKERALYVEMNQIATGQSDMGFGGDRAGADAFLSVTEFRNMMRETAGQTGSAVELSGQELAIAERHLAEFLDADMADGSVSPTTTGEKSAAMMAWLQAQTGREIALVRTADDQLLFVLGNVDGRSVTIAHDWTPIAHTHPEVVFELSQDDVDAVTVRGYQSTGLVNEDGELRRMTAEVERERHGLYPTDPKSPGVGERLAARDGDDEISGPVDDSEPLADEPDPQAKALMDALGVTELTARLLVARGHVDVEAARGYLKPKIRGLANPHEIADFTRAVARLAQAVKADEHIAVFGDYDGDGVTSVAILVRYLRDCGATVSAHIASSDGGYGLTVDAVMEIGETDADLLVVVGAGANNAEAIELTGDKMDVVVIGQHRVPPGRRNDHDDLIVVNPRRADSDYEFEGLSDAGLAFHVAGALRTQLNENGYFTGDNRAPRIHGLMGLAALGTVAAGAPLVDVNRVMVANGLRLLAQGGHPGVAKLLELAGLGKDRPLDVQVIIDAVVPLLGALGGGTSPALRLLLAESESDADRLTEKVVEASESHEQQKAKALKKARKMLGRSTPYGVIVLAHRKWPASICGAVATELVQEYRMPAFIGSIGEDGVVRGTARSWAEVDVYGLLSSHSSLLLDYGGHADAAGFACDESMLPRLRVNLPMTLFASHTDHVFAEPPDTAEFEIDGFDELVQASVLELRQAAGPYGTGNPEPMIGIRGVTVLQVQVFGDHREHVRITVVKHGEERDLIGYYRAVDMPRVGSVVDAIIVPEVNYVRGSYETTLLLKSTSEVEEEEEVVRDDEPEPGIVMLSETEAIAGDLVVTGPRIDLSGVFSVEELYMVYDAIDRFAPGQTDAVVSLRGVARKFRVFRQQGQIFVDIKGQAIPLMAVVGRGGFLGFESPALVDNNLIDLIYRATEPVSLLAAGPLPSEIDPSERDDAIEELLATHEELAPHAELIADAIAPCFLTGTQIMWAINRQVLKAHAKMEGADGDQLVEAIKLRLAENKRKNAYVDFLFEDLGLGDVDKKVRDYFCKYHFSSYEHIARAIHYVWYRARELSVEFSRLQRADIASMLRPVVPLGPMGYQWESQLRALYDLAARVEDAPSVEAVLDAADYINVGRARYRIMNGGVPRRRADGRYILESYIRLSRIPGHFFDDQSDTLAVYSVAIQLFGRALTHGWDDVWLYLNQGWKEPMSLLQFVDIDTGELDDARLYRELQNGYRFRWISWSTGEGEPLQRTADDGVTLSFVSDSQRIDELALADEAYADLARATRVRTAAKARLEFLVRLGFDPLFAPQGILEMSQYEIMQQFVDRAGVVLTSDELSQLKQLDRHEMNSFLYRYLQNAVMLATGDLRDFVVIEQQAGNTVVTEEQRNALDKLEDAFHIPVIRGFLPINSQYTNQVYSLDQAIIDSHRQDTFAEPVSEEDEKWLRRKFKSRQLDGIEYPGGFPDFAPFRARLNLVSADFYGRKDRDTERQARKLNKRLGKLGLSEVSTTVVFANGFLGSRDQDKVYANQVMTKRIHDQIAIVRRAEGEATAEMFCANLIARGILDKDGNFVRLLGFVWHHKEDMRTMELVDQQVHAVYSHSGGISMTNQVQGYSLAQEKLGDGWAPVLVRRLIFDDRQYDAHASLVDLPSTERIARLYRLENRGQSDLDRVGMILRSLKYDFKQSWDLLRDCLVYNQWPDNVPHPDPAALHRVMGAFIDWRAEYVERLLAATIVELKQRFPSETSDMSDQDILSWTTPGRRWLGSNYYVSLSGAFHEHAVGLFNELFLREFEVQPGTALDVNVFARDFLHGVAPVTRRSGRRLRVGANEEVITLDEHKAQGHASQLGWAFTGVRRSKRDSDWKAFKMSLVNELGAYPSEEVEEAIVLAEARYEVYRRKVLTEVERVQALKQEGEDDDVEVAAEVEAAEVGLVPDPSLADDYMAASNRLYVATLREVAALRAQIRDLAQRQPLTTAIRVEISTLGLALKDKLSEAAMFANEALITEGATRFVVYGHQMIGDPEYLAAMNRRGLPAQSVTFEQEREAVVHALLGTYSQACDTLQRYRERYPGAVARASKYILPMIEAAIELGIDTPRAHLFYEVAEVAADIRDDQPSRRQRDELRQRIQTTLGVNSTDDFRAEIDVMVSKMLVDYYTMGGKPGTGQNWLSRMLGH